MVQVSAALALAGRGGPLPAELWSAEQLGDDFADAYTANLAAAVEAWATPPAEPILLGTFAMPAAAVASMLVTDLTIHGWDLARPGGRAYGS